MAKPLGGKVVLVTGETRLMGLGAAIAHALARAGADLGLGYCRAYDRQQPWGALLHESAAGKVVP
jgi:NAD(P)-dependent dehydrogenase (short-subunit alcohol dehydrogenase family)